LLENVARNHRDNIVPIPKGLSDVSEEVNIHDCGSASSIECQINDDRLMSIDCITIDDFVRDNQLERVDLIKFDVEGAEERVLRGAIETIKRWKPKLAISAYHKNDDLIVLGKLIKSLNPNYRLHLGHGSTVYYESVIFAV